MPDQDRQTGRVGEPSGSDGRVLIVPARVVDWLREGVFAGIGCAAQALDAVAFADDREARPERFRGPTARLVGMYALLDAIGWAGIVPPVDVQVDLRTDRRALMEALEEALGFAEEDAGEAVRRDVEHAETGLAEGRDVAIERVGVLRDFIAVAQVRIDALMAEEEGGV